MASSIRFIRIRFGFQTLATSVNQRHGIRQAGGEAMASILNYEKRHEPVAARRKFRSRLLFNLLIGIVVIATGLAIGMAGYEYFAGMGAVDAFLNSAMILSGMGPIGELTGDGAKIFAGVYAIFCGLLIFAVAGLILAPVLHRVLHRFHVEDKG
jgi:putative effector of murein hydrolase